MGCGQSKIGIIYPRKSKNKSGRKRSGSDGDSDEEDAEADCGPAGAEDGQRGTADGASASDVVGAASGDALDGEDGDAGAARKPPVPATPGPLLAQSEMSSSQMDFFRMLDEKIESGPDYDSGSEEEKAAERARLRALLRDWETASQASSARSAASAPVTPLHSAAAHPFGAGPAASFFNVNGDLPLHRSLVAAPGIAAAVAATAPGGGRAWPPVAAAPPPMQCFYHAYPPPPMPMPQRWCQPPPPPFAHFQQHHYHNPYAPHPSATAAAAAAKCCYPPAAVAVTPPTAIQMAPHPSMQVQWCQPPVPHNSVVQYRKSRGVYTELA